MRIYSSILVISMISMLPAVAQTEYVTFEGRRFHPTRILAKFKDARAMNTQPVVTKLNSLTAVVKEELGIVPGLVVLEEAVGAVAVKSIVANPLSPESKGQRLIGRVVTLQNSGLFDFVEPDFVRAGALEAGDTWYADGRLWGLRNRGLNQNGGFPGTDISAHLAWNITTGSTNVIVAVIDSGIRYTHQDLSRNIWRNPDEIAGNGVDDDRDGYVDNVFGINAINGSGDPRDENGHGTHVAGIIGAAANNGSPVVGVAWNVRLMACKFLDNEKMGLVSNAIKCINFALQKKAQIINASFATTEYSQAEFAAFTRARDAGVLVIAAAGNDATDNDATPHYPANHQLNNIIAVTAIDQYDNFADFSNFGQTTVHVAAPGVDIISCGKDSDRSYVIASGTSAAAPFVAGVAALFLARYPDSSFSLVRGQILNTAVPMPLLRDKTITSGRVNALNALTLHSVSNLFSTSFEASEAYAAGFDLGGQNGWIMEGSGGNGIEIGPQAIFGQRVRLGRDAPIAGDSGLIVTMPFDFSPKSNQVVKFSVLMSITASNNSPNDKFRWSFSTTTASALFALEMNPANARISYLLQENTNIIGTGRGFTRNIPQPLTVLIDAANNRWSASLDSTLLATNQPITSVASALSFGNISASWLLTDTNTPGNNSIIFDNFRVEVLESMRPPVIGTQPYSQTAMAGQTTTFSVGVDKRIPSAFQWQRQDASANWNNLPGKTRSSLVLTNTPSTARGSYRVIVSNGGGTVTSDSALLKVFSPDEFRIRELALLPDASVRIRAAVAPGLKYVLESSENLAVWTEAMTTLSATEDLEIILPGHKQSKRFYRLRFVWE